MPITTSEQIERYEAAPSQIIAALEGLDEAQIHHIPAEESMEHSPDRRPPGR